MNLTPSQQKAVDIRGCSLLISAGAGSGKTAVLTQRIMQRLCDDTDDCDVTDFLVVTFTNAAAKELSDRIRTKLSEAARKNPSNKKIMRNLALLPLAKISTINSFCYDVVKKNFQTLGLSPSVRIADDAEMKVLRERIMNEVIDDAFESDNEDFLARFYDVSEMFSGSRSDEGFVDILLGIDNRLRADVEPRMLMSQILNMYIKTATEEDFFNSPYGKLLCNYSCQVLAEVKARLEKMTQLASDAAALEEKYLPTLFDDIQQINLMLSSFSQGYNHARDAVCGYSASRMGVVKNYPNEALKELVKETRDDCKAKLKKLGELYGADEKTMRACAYDCSQVIEVLFMLIEDFCQRLDARKKDLGIVDFNDVEHLTIELLSKEGDSTQPSEAALAMRRQYKEIYIDEYQDVNTLQDRIFKLISNVDENGGEKSRFMVGDIKQSIYRFRGARPDIFQDYRDTFGDVDGDYSAKRIFMQDNFRCSKSVIELTNLLFCRLMGNDYQTGDSLNFKRPEQIPVSAKAQLLVSSYDADSARGLSVEEIECHIIAKKIKEIVNNHEFRDSNGNTFGYGNVAVLARSKDTLKTFCRIFSQYGIPFYSDVGESFYGKKEILLSLCMLNSIDNPLRDIYLAGFMRSVVGGFSDDELCVIKQHSKPLKLYQSVIKYAEDKADTCLGEKCACFISRLDEYRSLSRAKNAAEFLWELYEKTDLLDICSSPAFNDDTPEVCADRKKNLLKLYEMARAFTKTSFRGLGAFMEYIDGASKKTDEKAEAVVGTDSVSLMTMHASKGLEFPVCFVSGLAKDFKNDTDKAIFSYTDGIGINLKDMESITCQSSKSGKVNIDTPYKKLVSYMESSRGIKEEMRILYVALTRARDYLFMTGCERFGLSKILRRCYVNGISGCFDRVSCFTEAIFNCIMQDNCALPFISLAELEAMPVMELGFENYLQCEYIPCDKALANIPGDEAQQETQAQQEDEYDQEVYNTLKQKGAFEYPDFTLTRLPSKLTVSQLKTGLIDEDGEMLSEAKRDLMAIPSFCLEDTKPKANEKGTAMHLFMQFADYKACEGGNCRAEAQRLLDNGFIDKRSFEMLDTDVLDEFFSTPLYARISQSKNVYRETRFNLKVDANDYSESIPRGVHSVLVQGVIDLYFENSDGSFTVVDFKTDRVYGNGAEETLIQRHKAQLEYYCKAVGEIMEKPVKEGLLFSFALMREIPV